MACPAIQCNFMGLASIMTPLRPYRGTVTFEVTETIYVTFATTIDNLMIRALPLKINMFWVGFEDKSPKNMGDFSVDDSFNMTRFVINDPGLF